MEEFEDLFVAFMALSTSTNGYWDFRAAVFEYLKTNGVRDFAEWMERVPARR
jgi:hypothetical protein